MLRKTSSFAFIIILSVLLGSCDSFPPVDKICTSEFRMIGITVFTTENEPVVLDEITITTKQFRREIELDVCGNGYDCENEGPVGRPESGAYTIFHDGMRKAIRRGLMKITVAGKNEQVQFEEEFVISDDGCHISKEAGPDTVFVEIE